MFRFGPQFGFPKAGLTFTPSQLPGLALQAQNYSVDDTGDTFVDDTGDQLLIVT